MKLDVNLEKALDASFSNGIYKSVLNSTETRIMLKIGQEYIQYHK